MNQIFLGEPVQEIKNWFVETFPSQPSYTTLEFVDGSTQTKEISGIVTQQNIGIYGDRYSSDTTLKLCSLGKNVTEIDEYTFRHFESLTSINIPNSVTSIGRDAFYNCYSLPSITIPNSVSSIRRETFFGCSSLTSINIPNSVYSIGRETFFGCNSLTSINIPNSVSSIGYYAFYSCESLSSVIFEGKTNEQVIAMSNFPWGINNTSLIKGSLSSALSSC